MKVKSLLAAGTVAVSLGASAFSITSLTHAASTEITAAMFNNAEACGVDANFVVTVPNNVICVNGDAYYFGNGEYVINEDVNITKTLHLDNSTLTINKGTFSPTNADAIYLYRNSNLTVNDGTFSGVFAGIMAETEYLSGAPFAGTIKINGGTISGGSVALAMEYGEGLGNRVVLKGGTFNGSNPGDYKNAIVVLNSADTTLFDSFLASGYHYTNNTKYSTTTNMSIASLGGTSTKVEADTTTSTDTNTSTNNNNNTNTNTPTTDNKKKAMEEMSREMEKVIASSTSSKSTKKAAAKKTIKAPNTGAVK